MAKSNKTIKKAELMAEDVAFFRSRAWRPRDLTTLCDFVKRWEEFLRDNEDALDETFFLGLLTAMDETKLVISAIPAKTMAEYKLKTAVLTGATFQMPPLPEGLIALRPEHGFLVMLAKASLHFEMRRLERGEIIE